MAVQTTYPLNPAIAFPGLVEGNQDKTVVTRSCETAAGIGFGLVVSPGTDTEKQCVLGGAATGFGITVRDLTHENPISGDPEYSENEAVAIIRSGYVWVIIAVAAVAGTALKYNDTTGSVDSGAAGAGETAMDNCELVTTVAANNGLGLVKINPASIL